MKLLLILIATTALASATEFKITYDAYKVIKIPTSTKTEEKYLRNLVESDKKYQFWANTKLGSAEVVIPPNRVDEFISKITSAGLQYHIKIHNLKAMIDAQVSNRDSFDNPLSWTKYHTLSEIHAWLDGLVKKHPNIVNLIRIGRSYEGREIKGVKLTFGKQRKPGVFIEAGIHANEWISPATATYLINELLTSRVPSVRKLAETCDWYILPSLNVDGYVYTHTVDRMWRKNRSPSNANCTGVDLNRNWDYKWLKLGASNDSCDVHYAGSRPFSEPETAALSKYLSTIAGNLFAYIDFHAFGQLLMVPYGDTTEKLGNYNETYAIGLKAAAALARRYGTQYKVGNIAETIYPASGSSLDWLKAKFGLPLAYCYELRDKGTYGMLLPPEQIIPTGREILDSLLVMFEEARKYGYPKPL